MSAAALLDELHAAGVRLSQSGYGYRLHYQTQPGVSIAPYRDRIAAQKPMLVKELLKRSIVEALDVDPHIFDRAGFDRLWLLWQTQDATEESTP